ncbi:MAG TPA: 1-(5-phosphoribosyl)-5-[(5-phosphoribosylamino)methylideneamino] imidazole-4-carboxamide isomerase [Steroidobacteraceae bacterium]|nr:1-(5-phosphoribosyl)-5-[(5-phosphoribosylamino)methylideneamino] imidazole-4-carboxamide isomerase [Steroidobacteraceae bacterium]
MLVIPSIDLRGGHCVRLLKGEFQAETRYALDPRELVRRYADAGARWLHLVDLDGARDGTPGNGALVRQMAAEPRVQLQLGGGLRTRAAVEEAFASGAARAVIGSAAVEQPQLLRELLAAHGAARICLAIDVRIDDGGVPRVRTRGWVREHALSLWELLESFADTPLLHVLCTDVERDGALAGPAFALYEEARRRFPRIAWQASGGIRSAEDLARLAALGLAAAISGKALLEGHIQLEELQPYLRGA